jgi:hypothetical protein
MTAPGKSRSSGCFATIRMTARFGAGHAAGAAVGSVFADVGWAGEQAKWREPRKLLAGAGVGRVLLDGLLRLDAARGLEHGGGWRVDFYLEIR